jgi:hypothetical protein
MPAADELVTLDLVMGPRTEWFTEKVGFFYMFC